MRYLTTDFQEIGNTYTIDTSEKHVTRHNITYWILARYPHSFSILRLASDAQCLSFKYLLAHNSRNN